jgi:hypothetical protein
MLYGYSTHHDWQQLSKIRIDSSCRGYEAPRKAQEF